MPVPGEPLSEPLLKRVAKTMLYPVRVLRWALRGLKYNTKKGYREDKYWEDRHRKFKGDFRAVASYSEEESIRYPIQKEELLEILRKHNVAIAGRHVVEFGSGNGYWGGVMLEAGAASYTGIDISQTAVDFCRNRFPKGQFIRHHLGESPVKLERKYDLVCSVDVTQHVVERPKLMQFLGDMQNSAESESLIFCTSYLTENEFEAGVRRKSMNVNFVVPWSVKVISDGLSGCDLVQIHRFWDKSLLVYKKRS
jgi:cyclopropane fatty-acyl-phospholipid synthase-like methyltransferase